MEPDETAIERSGTVNDLHGLRLMALLHDPVHAREQRGVARVLGIDHRTVGACMESGELEVVLLIGEHGLTLLPMTYPWTDRQREVRVGELRQEVRNLRRRRRRWLRRVLTLGLWWE